MGIGNPSVAAAVRALHEGAKPTVERLAAAAGCTVSYLEKLAKREGWKTAKAGRSVEGRVAVLVEQAITAMEGIGLGEGGEVTSLDKTRIDAISTAIRTLEKIGEFTRDGDSAKENQMRSDAEIAGILERIDRRIEDLARAYAAELVGGSTGTA